MDTTQADITWDQHGVPTITGESDAAVCHGFGRATAMAHAREVLELYGRARGRAAALWGRAFLEGDLEHARLGLDAHVDEWVAAQEPQTLRRLEAFCQGFTAACAADEQLGGDRRAALPVVPRDVVAHVLSVFVTFARFWETGLAFAPSPGGLLGGGSSAWAVTAERSTTGEAMLLINPHIPWAGPFRLMEARTVSPARSCHGVTPLGFPWQSFAYTSDVGWTNTVNPIPLLWVYGLDEDEDGYLYAGRRHAFTEHRHVVEVLDGEAVTVVERRSVHGPVLTAPDGATVAVRIAGVLHHPATGALETWWQMSLATSVHEVLEALEQRPLPMFNVVAADRTGSVAAAFCGAVPHRPGGTFADSGRRLPGDDPAQLWDELVPQSVLPRVVDPPSGWVQNVNDPPWWFTEPPLPPSNFPDGIAPDLHQIRDLRSPVSRRHLRGREHISPQDLLDLKWETHVRLADAVLEDLLAAARARGDLDEAVRALDSWDRRADPGSRGYPLFHLWAHEHLPLSALVMDGTHLVLPPEPGGVPTGLVDPAAAAAALRRAADTLEARGLALDVRYGQFAALGEVDGELVPASGAPSYLGVLRCLELTPTADGWRGIGGDTWIALINFGTAGPTTSGLLVPGGPTEATSPRAPSALPDLAAARLRPVAPLPRPARPSRMT